MEKSLFDTNRLIDAYRNGESLNGYTTILNLIEFPKAIEFNLRVMFPSKSDYGEKMKTKVARRHQITIPEEIRKKARIAVGDVLDIPCLKKWTMQLR